MRRFTPGRYRECYFPGLRLLCTPSVRGVVKHGTAPESVVRIGKGKGSTEKAPRGQKAQQMKDLTAVFFPSDQQQACAGEN